MRPSPPTRQWMLETEPMVTNLWRPNSQSWWEHLSLYFTSPLSRTWVRSGALSRHPLHQGGIGLRVGELTLTTDCPIQVFFMFFLSPYARIIIYYCNCLVPFFYCTYCNCLVPVSIFTTIAPFLIKIISSFLSLSLPMCLLSEITWQQQINVTIVSMVTIRMMTIQTVMICPPHLVIIAALTVLLSFYLRVILLGNSKKFTIYYYIIFIFSLDTLYSHIEIKWSRFAHFAA